MPPIVVAPKNASPLNVLGNTLELKVTSAETQGAFSVVDFRVAPGFVAPPIYHANTREDWWGQVLEGEIAVEAKGGPTQRIGAGGWVFVPRGTPFRWWNPEPKPARWLLTYSPGGFEAYFVEAAREIAEKKPKTPQEVGALAGPLWDRYGVTH
jgi:quercetin dioxygenase-like cupin family protein